MREYKKIKADKIFDGKSFLPENKTLVFNKHNTLIDIIEEDEITTAETLFCKGIVCPGFVNVHCHTELSHLQNAIPQQTGLMPFLLQVVTKRHLQNESQKFAAIEKVIQRFEEEGVVAIGDICNTTDSIQAKKKSSIYFHNFIETIGFDAQFNAEKYATFTHLLKTFLIQLPQHKSSLSPHAPYSFSSAMFAHLQRDIAGDVVSMHNQECVAENDLYQKKQGDFIDFFKQLNLPIDFFSATQKSSIQSVLPFLLKAQKAILVHNVFIDKHDIDFLRQQPIDIYFALCCKANLFIQNTLPPLHLLLEEKASLVIGTDSFASNTALSMMVEMTCLQQHFPKLQVTQLLQWATYNGAKALGIDNTMGSFEIGKSPGIVCIQNYETVNDNIQFTAASFSQRIVV